MSVTRKLFGHTATGAAVDLFSITNHSGITAHITNYGATLVALQVPDRRGARADVVLGFDALDGYCGCHPHFGGVIGRYANRIAGGAFKLQGVAYALTCNDGRNHLHGGGKGFDRVLWQLEQRPILLAADSLTLTYDSPSGEEGYPGNLRAAVTYSLSSHDALHIEYVATTDFPTIVNLTNHSYFNLAGDGDVLDHRLQIAASQYLPVDEELIPRGEPCPAEGSAMDFTRPKRIGSGIDSADRQLAIGHGGYDHNWVLDKGPGTLGFAARLSHQRSGRVMDVYTTQPGLQFYSGNLLDGSIIGKDGRRYAKHHGLCLETQHFPDSPNRPQYPSTLLTPRETYRQLAIYQFSVME